MATERILRILASAGIVAGLAACQTLGPTESRAVAEPMAPAQAPELKIGKTLVYENQEGERYRVTVAGFDGAGGTMWQASDGASWTLIDSFAGYTAWDTLEDDGTQEFTGDSMFPLQDGRTMHIQYQGQSTRDGNWVGERICHVDGQEAVTVKAGTFDVFKVSCRAGSDVNQPARRRTFYYSPDVGASVLTIHQILYENRVERDELVQFADSVEELPTS